MILANLYTSNLAAEKQSGLDITATLALLEYLGSLEETNDGLIGPDVFIKSGISDIVVKAPKPKEKDQTQTKDANTKNNFKQEVSHENL